MRSPLPKTNYLREKRQVNMRMPVDLIVAVQAVARTRQEMTGMEIHPCDIYQEAVEQLLLTLDPETAMPRTRQRGGAKKRKPPAGHGMAHLDQWVKDMGKKVQESWDIDIIQVKRRPTDEPGNG